MTTLYNPAAIRAKIVTLLSGIQNQSSTAILAAVYDYPNANPEGYPCAILDMDADQGSFLDNITNLHVITFKIWIIQEISAIGGQDLAMASLDAACNAIIPTLELITNMSLGGTVLWTEPTSGGRKQTQTENGPVFYKEIILKCNVTSQLV